MTDYYESYKSKDEVIEAWRRGELFITGFTSKRGNEVDVDKLVTSVTYTFDHVAEIEINYNDEVR